MTTKPTYRLSYIKGLDVVSVTISEADADWKERMKELHDTGHIIHRTPAGNPPTYDELSALQMRMRAMIPRFYK